MKYIQGSIIILLGVFVSWGIVNADINNPTDTSGFLENVSEDSSPSLSGDLDAGGNDITDVNQVHFDEVHDNGTSTVDSELDWTEGNKQKITLDDSPTLTFVDPGGPAALTVQLIQDSSGSRTVTWPAAVRWPGGTAPTLTTDANAVDIVSCLFDGTNYDCDSSLDFQ